MNQNCTLTLRFFFLFWILAAFSIPSLKAQIFPPDGVRMPGQWNGWANSTSMGGDFDLQRITSGTLRWSATFEFTGATGTQQFKFASTSFGDPWGNQWAGNTAVQINALQNFTYGTPSEPNNGIAVTQGKWYTVLFEDSGYANTRAVFMETDQQPVQILAVAQHPALPQAGEQVEVTAQLSAAPSQQEVFYLRYTTDQWQSSTMVEMNVTGTQLAANMPGQDSETLVEYYVFSSVIANLSQEFDLFTLRFNNNNGLNFSYVVDQPIDCGQQIDVVTTQPAFPLDNAEVTLFFNAALGNGGLFNFEGEVYAHTGVITNLSQGSSDWRYVKTTWGQNTPETRLTRLENNLYMLQIPNVRQYYGVPQSEQILHMAFVFRSGQADTSGNYQEHKNADQSDIFVTVYEQALNVKILSPGSRNPLVSPNQVLPICVEAIENQELFIFLNGELLSQQSGSSLSYPLVLQTLEPGTHWISAMASDATAEAWDSVAIYLRGPVWVEELPAGMQNGINYHSNNTSATLVLHDPAGLKQFAFVIGDFSNWLPTDATYMKRTPDGQRHWITLEGLQPGVEYAYQYLIDGTLRLADAYAEKILDPWNDRWIPQSTYPNLKAYPFDKTTGIVSVLHPGRAPFQWEVPDFTPVALNETQSDLVIYELLVRDFLETRAIADVIDKLDYLADLGVNAIQLMPIMEFDGNDSWGYAPNFFFATDKYYGTRQAYKEFIDEAHKRGIAVILDIVPNHAFGQNPMVNMYFDPSAGDYGQPAPENPWFNPQAPHPYSVGYDFNHESPHVREFFKRVFAYWLTEFNVDGFRIDLSKGLTQNFSGSDMGAWSAYDQSRINILTDYYNHIKSVKPNAYVILEHFAHNSEETVLANTGMMLWSAMHDNYKQVAMGWQDNSNLAWAHHSTRGWNYPNLIDYMENHDEERLMFEALSWGNSSGGYDLKDTLTALTHMQMAAVLFLGIPGPKMIWQFGELGYDYSIFYGGDRTAAKPVRLDYWDVPERQALHRVYNAMVQLRSRDAFRFGQFTHDLGGLGKRMWVSHASLNVVITGNMGVTGFDMAPGFQHTGTWYDYFSGESFSVTDPAGHSFYYPPGSYRVFTSQPLPRPFFNLSVRVINKDNQSPLQGARVSVQRAGQRLTDTAGDARFTTLPGSFELEVDLQGYGSWTGTVHMDQDRELVIELAQGGNVNVTEVAALPTMRIYPNPAQHYAVLEASQGSHIRIYNLSGQMVYDNSVRHAQHRISTHDWPRGVYLVHTTWQGNKQVQKLILQ